MVRDRAGIEPLFLGVGADQRRGEGIMKRFVEGVGGKVGSLSAGWFMLGVRIEENHSLWGMGRLGLLNFPRNSGLV